MSQEIDEKVVEMRFDNKQFEREASTTMTTLQKLKKSLDFSKIGDSFSAIEKASKKVDISGLGSAVETVKTKFSALEVMAITTLGNITNSVVNAGKKWLSAFTVDPIKTGFQEYETQINAVQTILANTQKEGTNIKDVNKALDELNTYADKTIYNFTEMTRNIGTFTAAGIKLDTSVNAIQGIANLAAVSGSNSQQASTAMYQLSQALATGTVRLMDWNSVVNAGMGGQVFQDALKETSELLGTGAERAIKATGSFRESLKEGWLTSEVLTETLKKFTTSGAVEYLADYTGLTKEVVQSEWESAKAMYGEADAIDKAAEALAKKSGKNKDEIAESMKFAQTAEDSATKVKTFTQLISTLKEAIQSGWSQSFRIIIGDFEEAKGLFTEISNSFGETIKKSADARNQLLEKVFNKQDAQTYISNIVGVTKEAVNELQIIGKEAGTTSDAFKETLNTFTKGDKSMSNLVTRFIEMSNSEKDVVSYLSDITGIEGKKLKGLQNLGKEAGFTSEEFKELANVLAKGNPEMQTTITNLLEMNDAIQKPSGRELLIDSLKNGLEGLNSVIAPIKEAFKDVFHLPSTADEIYGMLDAFHEFTETLTLSEENSENLRKTFKGIFDIAKLLTDGLGALVNLIPISSILGELFDIVGASGEALSSFSVWIRNFPPNIVKAYNTVSNSFSSAMNWLGSFVEKAKSLNIVKNIIESLKNVLSKFEVVTGKVELRLIPFTKIIGSVFGTIKKAGPVAVTVMNKITDVFSSLLNSISKALGTNEFSSIYDLFNVAVLSGLGIQLSKFIKNINQTVSGVGKLVTTTGGFVDTIKNIGTAITNTFNTLQSTLKAHTLKQIGIALALVAGSIFVISMIDSKKLSGSLAAVTVLMTELTGVFILLNKIDANKKGAVGALRSLVSMSLSVLILASALKKISDIDSNKLLGSLGAITALLTEMTAISIVLSKYGGKVKTGVAGIIAFSTAIYILTASVKKLGDMNIDVLKKGLSSVGILLAELAAFMAAAKFGKFKPKQALGLLILSGALIILQKSVEKFGTMDTKTLLTGIVAVAAVLAELAAFSLAAGSSKNILSTSISLVIMAKALEMLEHPMLVFGSMNLKQIGKGLLAMGGALAEITIAMKLMPKNSLSIGIGLLVVANSLSLISDIVLKMSGMSWIEIAKGMVALGGSLGILALAMNAMKGTLGASAAMLVMSASLAMLTPVLKTLGGMSWVEIAKGMVALAAAFAVVGIAAGLLSPVIPSMLGLAGAMALLGVAAAAVGAGILALSIGLTTLAASGVAGAAALVEVAKILMTGLFDVISERADSIGNVVKTIILVVCDVIIECVPELVNTLLVVVKEVLKALADYVPDIVNELFRLLIGVIESIAANLPALIQPVINLFMQFFYGIANALNNIDPSILIEALINIGIISALMLAFSAMASLAPGAMVGILALGVVIAELAIVLAAIGALAQIPGLTWLINEGGDLLQGVGTAIGKFIGGIVGGFMGGVTSQFPQIGTDLSNFMINVQPFIDGASSIDPSSLQGVNALAKTILLLTAADILQGLTSWLTGGSSLVEFGKELAEFGPYFKEYADSVNGLKPEVVTASANAALTLADMAKKLPNSGGLAAKIFGDNSLSDFGKELEEFGPIIKQYSLDVAGLQPAAVEASANAAKLLADMAKELPNSGGLAAKIFGDNSLSDFGKELEEFGPIIKQYSLDVAGLQPAAVEASANAALMLSDMAKKLPNSGGLAALILGDNSLSMFGEELAEFGPLISEYADSVNGLKPEVVTASANAAMALASLANNLPNTGGLVSWFTGDNDLATFGEQLKKFGEAMSSYYNSITGINSSQLSSVILEFKKLVDLANLVSGVDPTGMSGFVEALGTMGNTGVTQFIAAFTNSHAIATTAIMAFTKVMLDMLQTKVPIFKQKGTASVNAYLTAIRIKYPEAKTTGTTLVNQVLGAIAALLPTFKTRGTATANQFLSGIKNKYPEAKTTGKTLGENVLNGCNEVKDAIKKAGEEAGAGFVQGLESKVAAAQAAAKKLANATTTSTKKTLDEHSPSKKMAQIGAFAGMGFVNELMVYVSKAHEAGKALGDATLAGANKSISDISEVFTNELSGEPVITPHVNMSEVTKSASDINRLFNQAIAFTSQQAGTVSMNFTKRQNPISDEEIQNSRSSQKPTIINNNFEQNNYSPKALSRIEIYRQTNNQFSRFTEAVNKS